MRDHSRVAPQFWTGTTGRQIRAHGPLTITVALYLLTCPSANMIGLYYLPLPVLCHETGSSTEGALEALRCLADLEYAFYDDVTEYVFVRRMAVFQLGLHPEQILSENDKRHPAIVRLWKEAVKTKFFRRFYDDYRTVLRLPTPAKSDAPLKPHPRASEAVGKVAVIEQEQENRTGTGNTPPPPESEWIEILNRETSRRYPSTGKRAEVNLRPVRARLAEGYTLGDAEAVVKDRNRRWREDPKTAEWLRPTTVFGPKFANYLAEAQNGHRPHDPKRVNDTWASKTSGEVDLSKL